MRADLQPAQAAVDWAVSHFPILERRLKDWRESSPYSVYREFDAQRGKDAIKVRLDKPLPLIVNAEVGALINSIRTSLDLLTTALAERNGHVSPKDTYFPICNDLAHFLDTGRGGGREKIKRLSAADQLVIENLMPYKGGNYLLYPLHQMDIMRKHRRLVDVRAHLSGIRYETIGRDDAVELPASAPALENETTIAWTASSAAHSNFEVTFEITLLQIPALTHCEVVQALNDFAGLATSIIKLFR